MVFADAQETSGIYLNQHSIYAFLAAVQSTRRERKEWSQRRIFHTAQGPTSMDTMLLAAAGTAVCPRPTLRAEDKSRRRQTPRGGHTQHSFSSSEPLTGPQAKEFQPKQTRSLSGVWTSNTTRDLAEINRHHRQTLISCNQYEYSANCVVYLYGVHLLFLLGFGET